MIDSFCESTFFRQIHCDPVVKSWRLTIDWPLNAIASTRVYYCVKMLIFGGMIMSFRTMSKKEKDIALFVAFCIEEYGAAKGIGGEQVIDLFSRFGVTEYLSRCYEPLHTQGRQWLIDEIDEFIGLRNNQ